MRLPPTIRDHLQIKHRRELQSLAERGAFLAKRSMKSSQKFQSFNKVLLMVQPGGSPVVDRCMGRRRGGTEGKRLLLGGAMKGIGRCHEGIDH